MRLWIHWDCSPRRHVTLDGLRKEYGETNLFDVDTWRCETSGRLLYGALDMIVGEFKPGEVWTCDNCTIVRRLDVRVSRNPGQVLS